MIKWCNFPFDQFDSPEGINLDVQMGDWVGLDAKEGSYIGATPVEFTSLGCTIYSFRQVLRAAAILNRMDITSKFEDLYDTLLVSFRKQFCTESGILKEPSTQTAKIMAIKYGLVENMSLQAQYLAEQIESNDCRITVGFIGIAYLLEALRDNGYTDLAYKLLLRTEYPSWLYEVKKSPR